MKWLSTIPMAAAVVAVAGWLMCRSAGWSLHGREMLAAAIVTCAAALLALVPSLLVRRGAQDVAAQAALAGTVLHLMLSVVLAALVWIVLRRGQALTVGLNPYLAWLAGFYWASLVALAAVLVHRVRTAPPCPRPQA